MLIGRSIAIVGLLFIAGEALSQQSTPDRIRVGWYGEDKPNLVKFEGGGPFMEENRYYVAKPDQRSIWATYDLNIVHGNEPFPVRVVTKVSQEAVTFHVRRASYQDCTRADVNSIWSDQRSTIDERVARMMRARHLLVNGRCPTPEMWKLAKRYFDTSCSLALDPRSRLDLSPEAQQLYSHYAVRPRDLKEAETCTAAAQQRAILDLQSRMRLARDIGEFKRVADELITHAVDPTWDDAFAALEVDERVFRIRKVHGIYARQLLAWEQRRVETALQLNGELLELIELREYKPALRAEAITRDKLCRDRALFLSNVSGSVEMPTSCDALFDDRPTRDVM